MVEQVVKQLDDVAGKDGKGTEMQIFHLKKARAEDVANTIRQALPPSTSTARGQRSAADTACRRS